MQGYTTDEGSAMDDLLTILHSKERPQNAASCRRVQEPLVLHPGGRPKFQVDACPAQHTVCGHSWYGTRQSTCAHHSGQRGTLRARFKIIIKIFGWLFFYDLLQFLIGALSSRGTIFGRIFAKY